jgi:hypothetical protein
MLVIGLVGGLVAVLVVVGCALGWDCACGCVGGLSVGAAAVAGGVEMPLAMLVSGAGEAMMMLWEMRNARTVLVEVVVELRASIGCLGAALIASS